MIRLPSPGSLGALLLKQIGHGSPVTLEGAINDPDVLPALVGKRRLTQLTRLFDDLLTYECLTLDGRLFHLTKGAQNYCDGIVPQQSAKYTGTPAGVRVVPVFTPPLQAKYLPSPHGQRAGSEDYRALPSHFATHAAP